MEIEKQKKENGGVFAPRRGCNLSRHDMPNNGQNDQDTISGNERRWEERIRGAVMCGLDYLRTRVLWYLT